jgi:dolichol-phosphate mannosyltransferase
VTGAGGFVGANLVRRLLAEGHTPVALVRPGGDRWRLAEVEGELELHEVDLLDRDGLDSLVHRERPEWVFHLAAHGAYSWQDDPRRVVETNAVGTVGLLEACMRADAELVVHAGSSSEYGFKDHAPSEDERVEPNSAYAVGKASATMYCSHAARSSALDAVTLRLYSVYGPFEDPRRLIPSLIVHGLGGRLPPLANPDVARDFVAVDDVVDAFLAAARSDRRERGGVYNVGSGRQTTLREIVEVARRVLEITAEPEWDSYAERDWDTSVWVADPRKAAELGWQPRIGLDQGFAQAVDWLRASDPMCEVYGVAG